jgi:hypothetical protein
MPEQTATYAARARAAAKARRQAVTHNGGVAVTTARREPPSAPDPSGTRSRHSSPSVLMGATSTRAAGMGTASMASSAGRDLARARRAAMATGGRNGKASLPAPAALTDSARSSAAVPQSGPAAPVAGNSSPAPVSPARSAPPTPPVFANLTPQDLAGLQGRDLARARRALLSKAGSTRAATRSSPPRQRASGPAPVTPPASAEPAASSLPNIVQIDQAQQAAEIDVYCTRVERQPVLAGNEAQRVRQWCRERRQNLATQGKRGLPPKPRNASRPAHEARSSSALAAAVQGRDAARLHRQDQCRRGRGSAPNCRPTGRVRPGKESPSLKVEEGTTLAGQRISGTQVERKTGVTGNESGSCRTITGTEYIGNEQFASFCKTRPEPAPVKVGASATSHGNLLTGTEVGRSPSVTGDETGSCRAITGTEYLGSERFEQFCASKGLLERPVKVVEGHTQSGGLRITGVDESRVPALPVTGNEPGAARTITGTTYADAGTARLTINGPQKVALTHTLAGRPVSGSEVGRSIRVTGDEAGSCRRISGTEYLSNEQFSALCHTHPEPGPGKFAEDVSQQGQRITGNRVDRSTRVTGNEPGACERITGSQYWEPQLCGGAPAKVAVQETLAGRLLTGTRVGRGPKMTGDEQGGCEPVTGTEYYGHEQYAEYCESTPVPRSSKVGISQSLRGLPVSGPEMGTSPHVTGAEYGADLAISGTPYVGREQLRRPAGSSPFPAGEVRTADFAPRNTPAAVLPFSGIPSVRPLPGLPRYAAPTYAPLPATRPLPDLPVEEPRHDFSIQSPARQARQRRERITGTAFTGPGRITGPINLATGLVSGTPEFRYREEEAPPLSRSPVAIAATHDESVTGNGYGYDYGHGYGYSYPNDAWNVSPPRNRQAAPTHPAAPVLPADMPPAQPAAQPATPPMSHAAVPAPAPAPMPSMSQALPPAANRITGDGREGGQRITGDSWGRNERVTGTEGRWSQGRNPTMRGAGRHSSGPVGAYANRELERPEVPPARITGSSGNHGKGPLITVSGGARG